MKSLKKLNGTGRTREWFAIAPAYNDHHPAIRVAIGIGVPLLTLVLIDRIDLAIFGAFAAFTGIYGRNQPHRQRLGSQLKAGSLLLALMFAAAMCAHGGIGPWGIVIGTTIVAGVGTLGTGFGRLKPAGSLFHIFAFGAIASVPHQAPVWQGMLTATVTFIFALVIGQSARVVRSRRTPWAKPIYPKFTQADRSAILLEAALYMLAAGAAGSIATALGIGHNYWAMVAAIVPLIGVSTMSKVGRSVNRILGTTVGLGLTWLILLLGLAPWQLVLTIALLQFLAEVYIARQYSIAQIFVTPLALMSTELANPGSPSVLIADRALETLIGSAVGIFVVLYMHYRDKKRQRVV